MVRRLRVVLQSRLSSSRLPAKALLPVGGLPLAALAARRAMQGGGDVVLATSEDPTDDLLVAEMARHGVPVVRGPLDDVLGRFLIATADLPEDALCVRLTADNTFPDAGFIATLAALRDGIGAEYLAYGGNSVDLPYGMAAEIFTVAALRAAGAGTSDPFDREHVTPFIRRRHRPATVPPFPGVEAPLGHLRCTVDTFDDYRAVAALFAEVPDPVAEPWTGLVARLAARPGAPRFHVRPAPGSGAAEFVLGTVQLGLAYGRTNRAGLPPETAARALVRRAIDHGVTRIDTARAYGQSEARLGRILAGGWSSRVEVMTKVSPLAMLEADWPPRAVEAALRESVLTSARALGLARLPTVMLHRAAHLDAFGGTLQATLAALVEEGVVGRIGVSVQSPAELARALEIPEVTHVQLPLNLLDHRWEAAGAALADRPGVRVDVRSAYLQGLLAAGDPALWPAVPGVEAAAILARLGDLAAGMGRTSVADLALAFVRGIPWVDGVVIGVETLDQLDANLAAFRTPPLEPDRIAEVRAALPILPEALLDPGKWPPKDMS